MALQKSIESATGAYSTYWRIARVSFDASTIVSFSGYLDKAARDDGKQAMHDLVLVIDVPKGTKDTLPFIYAAAKMRSEFSGATDV